MVNVLLLTLFFLRLGLNLLLARLVLHYKAFNNRESGLKCPVNKKRSGKPVPTLEEHDKLPTALLLTHDHHQERCVCQLGEASLVLCPI